MKLVHFADLHLDTPFRWAGSVHAHRRRQALRDTLGAIVDLALEEGADALTCGGDLYEHDKAAPDTGEVIRAAFARLGTVPVLVSPGNHDWLGPQSIYQRTAWSPNVHIFSSDALTPFPLADGFTVWGGAHRVPANTPGFLRDFEVDRGGVNIGMFHGSLRSSLPFQEEGKVPHAPLEEEEIPASGLDHALLGHFHTPAEGRWHTYPGNPEPLSFGERDLRGAVVAEFDEEGGVSQSWRRVSRTELHDIRVDLTGCASGQNVRDRAAAALAPLTGTARVTLHGEVDPAVNVDVADLDGVAPHLEAVVVRLERITAAYDFEALAHQTGTVRGRFVQDVLDADMDPDLERRVLITGLRALDGRTDLAVS